jgi:nitrile hydratase subunit beta
MGGQGVSRAHDIGGQTGFGPVPLDEDGLPFRHDWEARVCALNGVLRARGLYGVDEFRDAIERIPPQEYLELSYYERWLRAIETLLNEKALLPDHPLPDRHPLPDHPLPDYSLPDQPPASGTPLAGPGNA